ncbi:MAG: hypothetical protein ACRCY9_01675 [Phycicoccus sp.]
MPTTRPRHTVTETDALTRALDDAARRWPEDRESRTRLLLRLVNEGHRGLTTERESRADERRSAIQATSGALTGTYDDGYLDAVRDDWPA